MSDYSKYNATAVLREVETLVEYHRSFDIRSICDTVSIFDWWNDRISNTKLKQMQSFLRNAIKLGYDGYVCFKVGASGCSNGMWAYKNESTDGYSPDGDFLYRSFSPDYTYYCAKIDGKTLPDYDNYNSCKTIGQLKKLINC